MSFHEKLMTALTSSGKKEYADVCINSNLYWIQTTNVSMKINTTDKIDIKICMKHETKTHLVSASL